MILNVRTPDAPQVTAAALATEPGSVLVTLPEACMALSGVIQEIRNNCNSSASLDILRLCAHGNSGYMALSDEGLTAANARQMVALQDLMAQGGRVELHSCGTASDTTIAGADEEKQQTVYCAPGTARGGKGQAFIQALANAFGVPVTGALDCQYYLNDWQFEGQTITCYPACTKANPD